MSDTHALLLREFIKEIQAKENRSMTDDYAHVVDVEVYQSGLSVDLSTCPGDAHEIVRRYYPAFIAIIPVARSRCPNLLAMDIAMVS